MGGDVAACESAVDAGAGVEYAWTADGGQANAQFGMAVATVQVARPGVYIAMSGQVFEAGAVRKNRAENRFESLE